MNDNVVEQDKVTMYILSLVQLNAGSVSIWSSRSLQKTLSDLYDY